MKSMKPGALTLACSLAFGLFAASTVHAEKVLRIAMTAGDIPRTLGQPDQGFEGNRFTGIPMYDSLTQ
jgi:peptide/nickel transport system substrate-binding protein